MLSVAFVVTSSRATATPAGTSDVIEKIGWARYERSSFMSFPLCRSSWCSSRPIARVACNTTGRRARRLATITCCGLSHLTFDALLKSLPHVEISAMILLHHPLLRPLPNSELFRSTKYRLDHPRCGCHPSISWMMLLLIFSVSCRPGQHVLINCLSSCLSSALDIDLIWFAFST